ncbi:MAG: methylmalonyl-CoA mutase family protein, partial [Anaerolineae bacterium]
ATQHALRRLAAAARAPTVNLMEPIIEAVKAYATLGEMCDVLREVLGIYHEPVFF